MHFNFYFMKKNSVLFNSKFIILAFVSVFVISSCHKPATTEDTGYATEQFTSEKTFNDVQTIADQASNLSTGGSLNFRTSGTTFGPCATVTKTPGNIVIDFGTTDCICLDGRTRRGKILITYTGNYADSGSVHTITFDNFYQNDNKVTGTKTVTNMGHNALGQPYFNVSVTGSVTLAGGGTIYASWSRVRTWTNGYNTPTDCSDDVYSISGSGKITRANGTNVTTTISNTTPLIVAHNCKWIEAGTITFTLPDGLNRVLNYGDTPNCDNIAIVTLANGKTRTISLP